MRAKDQNGDLWRINILEGATINDTERHVEGLRCVDFFCHFSSANTNFLFLRDNFAYHAYDIRYTIMLNRAFFIFARALAEWRESCLLK